MTSGPIAANPPRAFFRAGIDEEEITPPCQKTRSFDSLSVAHILQAKLDPTASSKIPKAPVTNNCGHRRILFGAAVAAYFNFPCPDPPFEAVVIEQTCPVL